MQDNMVFEKSHILSRFLKCDGLDGVAETLFSL